MRARSHVTGSLTVRSPRAVVVPLLLALNAVTRSAFAEPSPTDMVVAQSLFEEGRALMDAGRYAEACEKLGLSQRLDPGGGTLLNLALCHEKEESLATAWTEFAEALSLARRDRREDRITFAEAHVVALGPRLPRVRLVVSGSPDTEVRLDDVLVPRAALGLALPLNPGRHVVSATASAKVSWSRELVVHGGEITSVEIPPLAPAPTVDAGGRGGMRRTIGWTALGTGGAALVVGAVVGLIALNKNSESSKLCPSHVCTNPEGVRASEDAVTAAWISNGSLAVGVVTLVVGTYLLLTPPSPAPTTKTKGSKGAVRPTPLDLMLTF